MLSITSASQQRTGRAALLMVVVVQIGQIERYHYLHHHICDPIHDNTHTLKYMIQ